MNNFGRYITPSRAKANGDNRTIKELVKLANKKPQKCLNCDELEWRYGGCGLCFSCTTGEADASGDAELKAAE